MVAIHLNEARRWMDTGELFSVKCWEIKSGELLSYVDVRCTSSSFRGGTRNIIFPNGQVRKLRDITIVEINGAEVYL